MSQVEAARLQDFEGKFDIRWPGSGEVKVVVTEVKVPHWIGRPSWYLHHIVLG